MLQSQNEMEPSLTHTYINQRVEKWAATPSDNNRGHYLHDFTIIMTRKSKAVNRDTQTRYQQVKISNLSKKHWYVIWIRNI